MKKLKFARRWRDLPPAALAPLEGRRPFRLWMTGSLAVVMAAMIPLRDLPEAERERSMRVLRHSPFGVTETVHRIEAAARDRGLPVLAVLPGSRSVLVLSSTAGGTPVVMDDADSQPAVPLSLMVLARRGGGADVLIGIVPGAPARRDLRDLPPAVAEDLAALPGLVDRALA
jgi:hypothetical protein